MKLDWNRLEEKVEEEEEEEKEKENRSRRYSQHLQYILIASSKYNGYRLNSQWQSVRRNIDISINHLSIGEK